MKNRKHSQTIIAEHFGMDVQDVIDSRYHYGLTPIPMYALGETGLLAVSKSMPRYEHWDNWIVIAEVEGGRKIWESKGE